MAAFGMHEIFIFFGSGEGDYGILRSARGTVVADTQDRVVVVHDDATVFGRRVQGPLSDHQAQGHEPRLPTRPLRDGTAGRNAIAQHHFPAEPKEILIRKVAFESIHVLVNPADIVGKISPGIIDAVEGGVAFEFLPLSAHAEMQ